MCWIKWYQLVGTRGRVKGSVVLNCVKWVDCEGMPVRPSGSLWAGWTLVRCGGSPEQLPWLDGPWREFNNVNNVWYKIYWFEDTWWYIVLCFDLAEIQRYTEITTQAWHSNCNRHLDHHAKVIPISGLYMPTVRILGIPSSLGRNISQLKPVVLFRAPLVGWSGL